MSVGQLPFSRQLLMTAVTSLGICPLEQALRFGSMRAMTGRTLALGKRFMQTEFAHVFGHGIMTLGAQDLLGIGQNSSKRTFMTLVTGQTFPVCGRWVSDGMNRSDILMTFQAQALRCSRQQGRLPGNRSVRLMTA